MDKFRDEAQAHDIDALGDYRDALLSGATPAELERLSAGLDPALLRLVQQMRSVGVNHLPQPAPTFARELERQLRQELIGRRTTTLPIPDASSNGHVPGSLHQHLAQSHPVFSLARTQSWRRYLIAAALVLLVIAGGLLGMRLAVPEEPVMLIAVNAPAVQTLLDTTIEGQAQDWTPLTIEHWTFQPGSASLQIPPLSGPQWVVSDAAPLVATIDGQERDIPTDSGIVILPGQALSVRNPGSEARSLIRGVAAAGFSLEEYDRQRIARRIALDSGAHEALPPGRSRLIFDRLLLQPGSTLMIEPATGLDWIEVASGSLGLTLSGPSVPVNWRSGHEREITAGESLPALVPGTRVTLRNVGDEPLVLLRLQVIPMATSSTIEADEALTP